MSCCYLRVLTWAPLLRRLRRPWLLLRRDLPSPPRIQSTLPRSYHPYSREPRVAANHTGIRFLRRVPAEIRLCERLAILLRSIRLSSACSDRGWASVLCAWGLKPQFICNRPGQYFRLLDFEGTLSIWAFQIRVIDRKQEVPHDGPMCDLLWSDPDGAF